MSRRPIPERDPVSDTVSGSLVQIDSNFLLCINPPADRSTDVVRLSGEITVRYGFPYLGKPHLSVVMGLLALDYGEMLTGDRAFEMLQAQYGRYPRADVIGYRNDGVDEMTVVKNLDMALHLHVLAYPTADATTPIGRAIALIATDDQAAGLPERLQAHIPRFDTIDAWKTYKDTHDQP